MLKQGFFPWDTILQDKHAPAQDSHELQSLTENFLWHRLSMSCGFFQGIPTCCGGGFSTGCSVDSCFTMVSMGCGGITAPVPGAPPLLPSSMTLVFTELFVTHTLTSLSQLLWSSFYPFLNIFSQRCYQLH